MKIKDKVIIVTGAASGIGRALCEVFARQAPKALICADVNINGAKETAINNNGIGYVCDVSDEQNIQQMIDHVEAAYGPIDLFCSNAGILTLGGAEVSNEDWQRIWEINVMAHVWAARHLVPKMLARGGGYFLNTASAAGLLTQIGSAPYSVTKHAAVSFAEWLVITYGTRGIKASVLCPQAVETAMTAGFDVSSAHVDGMKTAEEVALACLNAIENEEFMVLPHEEVLEYSKRRVMDKERWLKGMQKLNDLYGFEPS
ncbi:MAG: SDR family oxidoreductase [Parvibaculales bacterium]